MQNAMKVIVTVALMGNPGAAAAQTLGQLCEAVSTLNEGQWVEYEITGGQSIGFTSIRYANIGKEDRGGETHHRYELKMSGAQSMTSQMLIAGDGGPWDQDNLVEVVVQMAGQPPMTLSGDMLNMMRQNNQTPDIAKQCSGAEILGNESVTVPAGSWDTVHLRAPDGTEVWASLDVPMAVVRVVPSNGPVMELAGHGTGGGL